MLRKLINIFHDHLLYRILWHFLVGMHSQCRLWKVLLKRSIRLDHRIGTLRLYIERGIDRNSCDRDTKKGHHIFVPRCFARVKAWSMCTALCSVVYYKWAIDITCGNKVFPLPLWAGIHLGTHALSHSLFHLSYKSQDECYLIIFLWKYLLPVGSMFFEGDLQAGVDLALKDAKPIVCFVKGHYWTATSNCIESHLYQFNIRRWWEKPALAKWVFETGWGEWHP